MINVVNEVKLWGMPKTLEKENFQFYLDEEYSDHEHAKFYINDNKGNEMFMFRCAYIDNRKYSANYKDYMYLEEICVCDPKYRKNGIASFYLKKLKQMCISNDIKEIRLTLCTSKEDIDYERGYTNNKTLREFYNKFLGCEELELIFNN